jgi:hypothetical protein
VSGVRCERLVSRCAMSTRGVQCPVRASACPGVQCPCGRPVSVCAASEPGQVLKHGDGLAAGRGRVRVVAERYPRRARWLPSRSLALEAGASVLGQRGADLDSAVVVGSSCEVARSTAWRPGWAGCARGSASEGVRVRLLSAVIVEAWNRVVWRLRAFSAGLRLELAAAARPQRAASVASSELATL